MPTAVFACATATANNAAYAIGGQGYSGTYLNTVQAMIFATVSPPVITMPTNIVAEATSIAGAVVIFTTTATNLSGSVPTMNVPPSGTTFPFGTNLVTVTATDTNGNSVTNAFTVTVHDTTPPAITVSSNIVAEATSSAGAVVSFTTTATDLVSGMVTTTNAPASGSTFPLGVTMVNVTAGDAAGNVATNTFTVTVQDTTPPVITLLGPNPLTNYIHAAFTDPGATATDTVAGNLTDAIIVTGSVNTNAIGSYGLTYTVSDGHGNSAVTNRTVVVVAPTAPILSIVLTSVPGLTTNASGIFAITSSPGVAITPASVVVFTNADGSVNLACANASSATVTVLTNNGGGIFSSNVSYSVGAANASPQQVVAADINGDGKVDLITANQNLNSLSVLTNNGNGGFMLASTPSVGSYIYGEAPTSVAVFTNVDGKVDLACADANVSTLSILTNNGSGGFTLASSPGVGSNPYSVVAADVNGDGKMDLVSANFGGGGTLSVLTNNGVGGFVLAATYSAGANPRSVVAADVNGDGRVDLISANAGANSLTVYTNNGSGGFTLSGTYSVGSQPWSVTAADVNGDGAVDLISANNGSNSVTVYTNNGSGGFALAATLTVGSGPESVAVANMNTIGLMDLISANANANALTVLTNTLAVRTNMVRGVVISWPSPSTGFVLQQNGSLGLTNWTTNNFSITTANGTNSVTITPPAGNQFFRLAHP